jgi:hypothetical protein
MIDNSPMNYSNFATSIRSYHDEKGNRHKFIRQHEFVDPDNDIPELNLAGARLKRSWSGTFDSEVMKDMWKDLHSNSPVHNYKDDSTIEYINLSYFGKIKLFDSDLKYLNTLNVPSRVQR